MKSNTRSQCVTRQGFASYFGARLLAASVFMIACTDARSAEPADYLRLPEFVIGQPTSVLADDGSAERAFVNISARRLSNGMLVIADIAAATIRLYDGNGTLVRTLARGGNGPGELPGAYFIAVRDDTVLAFGEPPQSRPDVHVYSPTDGYQRLVAAAVSGQPAMSVLGQLSDKTYLVKRGSRGIIFNDIPKVGVLIPDSTMYGVFTPATQRDSAAVMWFPKVAARWYYSFPVTGNKIVPVSVDVFPLRARTVVVNSKDLISEIETGTGEFKSFTEQGAPRFTKRTSLHPTAFDAKRLALRADTELRNAKGAPDTARIISKYASAIRPREAPLFSRALAGDDGEIWLQLFDLDETSIQNFVIVDRAGVEIGRASLPAGIDPQQIGKNFVLGLRTQSAGAIEVVQLQLSRK